MRAVKVIVCLFVLGAALASPAQFFHMNLGGRGQEMPSFTGTVRLEPSHPVVGIPCAFVFTFTSKSRFEIQQVMGLPNANIEYLADSVEPYADNTYRLPVRFTAPMKTTLNVVVGGMQTVEQGNGTSFRSSYSTNFRKALAPLAINVKPLPEEGRPPTFSGAVGRQFDLTETLSPDRVRPGDLVTATYELVYDGYCPSNIWPRIERISKEFKVYEPKEVARVPGRVTWTQILVPRTVAATNAPLVSFDYYNSRVGRYERAQARVPKLVFISGEAASTQNTSVTVAGEKESSAAAAATAQAPLVLRFAPARKAPVVATLAPGTAVKELAVVNGWRRVEAEKAIGWLECPARK